MNLSEALYRLIRYWLISLAIHYTSALPVFNTDGDDFIDEYAQADVSGNGWLAVLSITFACILIFIAFGCLCCKFTSKTVWQSGVPVPFSEVEQTIETNDVPTTEFTIFPPAAGRNLLAETGGNNDDVRFEPLPDIRPRRQTVEVAVQKPRPATFRNVVNSGLSCNDWFEDPYSNFPRPQLQYVRELGSGWFGQVVEGEAYGIVSRQKKTNVVVKILMEGANNTDQMYFLNEVKPFRDSSHPNVLKLLGKCLETDPFLIILEDCALRDLKSYLIKNRSVAEIFLQENDLLNMVYNIATGLQYLHERGFILTDLAARNCLVSEDHTIKIGDYGNSIEMFKDDYYCAGGIAVPVRWCAPETLRCTATIMETREVTQQANVWSFGVVLWETLEFGKLPYIELSDDEFMQKVIMEQTERLKKPLMPCAHLDRLYQIIQFCHLSPKCRPNMERICAMFSHLKTYPHVPGDPNGEFEARWNALQPRRSPGKSEFEQRNGAIHHRVSCDILSPSPQHSLSCDSDFQVPVSSPSLQNLRGSVDGLGSDGFMMVELHAADADDLMTGNLDADDYDSCSLAITNTVSINGPQLMSTTSTSERSSEKEVSPFTREVEEVIRKLDEDLDRECPPSTSSDNLETFADIEVDRRLSEDLDTRNDCSLLSDNHCSEEADMDSLVAIISANPISSLPMIAPGYSVDSDGEPEAGGYRVSYTDEEDTSWKNMVESSNQESHEITRMIREKSQSAQDFLILTVIDNESGSDSDGSSAQGSLPNENLGDEPQVCSDSTTNHLTAATSPVSAYLCTTSVDGTQSLDGLPISPRVDISIDSSSTQTTEIAIHQFVSELLSRATSEAIKEAAVIILSLVMKSCQQPLRDDNSDHFTPSNVGHLTKTTNSVDDPSLTRSTDSSITNFSLGPSVPLITIDNAIDVTSTEEEEEVEIVTHPSKCALNFRFNFESLNDDDHDSNFHRDSSKLPGTTMQNGDVSRCENESLSVFDETTVHQLDKHHQRLTSTPCSWQSSSNPFCLLENESDGQLPTEFSDDGDDNNIPPDLSPTISAFTTSRSCEALNFSKIDGDFDGVESDDLFDVNGASFSFNVSSISRNNMELNKDGHEDETFLKCLTSNGHTAFNSKLEVENGPLSLNQAPCKNDASCLLQLGNAGDDTSISTNEASVPSCKDNADEPALMAPIEQFSSVNPGNDSNELEKCLIDLNMGPSKSADVSHQSACCASPITTDELGYEIGFDGGQDSVFKVEQSGSPKSDVSFEDVESRTDALCFQNGDLEKASSADEGFEASATIDASNARVSYSSEEDDEILQVDLETNRAVLLDSLRPKSRLSFLPETCTDDDSFLSEIHQDGLVEEDFEDISVNEDYQSPDEINRSLMDADELNQNGNNGNTDVRSSDSSSTTSSCSPDNVESGSSNSSQSTEDEFRFIRGSDQAIVDDDDDDVVVADEEEAIQSKDEDVVELRKSSPRLRRPQNLHEINADMVEKDFDASLIDDDAVQLRRVSLRSRGRENLTRFEMHKLPEDTLELLAHTSPSTESQREGNQVLNSEPLNPVYASTTQASSDLLESNPLVVLAAASVAPESTKEEMKLCREPLVLNLNVKEQEGDATSPAWGCGSESSLSSSSISPSLSSSTSGEFDCTKQQQQLEYSVFTEETKPTNSDNTWQTEESNVAADEMDEDEDNDEDDEPQSFQISVWNKDLAPMKSLMRSSHLRLLPEERKAVSFKLSRRSVIYEYPREEVEDVVDDADGRALWNFQVYNAELDYSTYADWELANEEMPEEFDEGSESSTDFPSPAHHTCNYPYPGATAQQLYKLSNIGDEDLQSSSSAYNSDYYGHPDSFDLASYLSHYNSGVPYMNAATDSNVQQPDDDFWLETILNTGDFFVNGSDGPFEFTVDSLDPASLPQWALSPVGVNVYSAADIQSTEDGEVEQDNLDRNSLHQYLQYDGDNNSTDMEDEENDELVDDQSERTSIGFLPSQSEPTGDHYPGRLIDFTSAAGSTAEQENHNWNEFINGGSADKLAAIVETSGAENISEHASNDNPAVCVQKEQLQQHEILVSDERTSIEHLKAGSTHSVTRVGNSDLADWSSLNGSTSNHVTNTGLKHVNGNSVTELENGTVVMLQ